ncbi:MAG: hypothetical protein HDS88_04190 [Bacteroidales bacterium]|nr:hypothetical protein [Bacteroidales bacterium]
MTNYESFGAIDITIVGTILFIVTSTVFLYGIVRSGRNGSFKMESKDMKRIGLAMAVIFCFVYASFLPVYFPKLIFDDIHTNAIEPMHGKAEIGSTFPWGTKLYLDNGDTYRIRVESRDEFIDKLNAGALIYKRADSNDIYLIHKSDTVCYPLNHSCNPNDYRLYE